MRDVASYFEASTNKCKARLFAAGPFNFAKLSVKLQSYFNDFGSDLLWGDFEFNSDISSAAAAGAFTLPSRMISRAVSFLPYSFSLALPSERIVEPASETPANSTLLRESERISAVITTSVEPSAVRPFGPAAAEASAPNLTLLLNNERAPAGFITRS